jgi:hypothetical protein
MSNDCGLTVNEAIVALEAAATIKDEFLRLTAFQRVLNDVRSHYHDRGRTRNRASSQQQQVEA